MKEGRIVKRKMNHEIFNPYQKGEIHTPSCEYFYLNKGDNIYKC